MKKTLPFRFLLTLFFFQFIVIAGISQSMFLKEQVSSLEGYTAPTSANEVQEKTTINENEYSLLASDKYIVTEAVSKLNSNTNAAFTA
jgi:hypothetical protein